MAIQCNDNNTRNDEIKTQIFTDIFLSSIPNEEIDRALIGRSDLVKLKLLRMHIKSLDYSIDAICTNCFDEDFVEALRFANIILQNGLNVDITEEELAFLLIFMGIGVNKHPI